MANGSFNSGFYNPATDQVTFYIYWTSITPNELIQFTNDDLSVVNAMGSTITGASAEVGPGDGNTFPITVSGLPSNSSGQLQVKVRANAIGTSLAVASPLISWSTRSSTTFTIGESSRDGIYNSATGGSKVPSPYNVNTVYVQITSTTSISDFSASDIIVAGGCGGSLTPSSGAATSWRLAVELTANTSGVVTISIPADSVSVGNDAKSFSFNYDRTPSVGTPSTVTFGSNTYQSSSGTAVSRKNSAGAITDGSFWVPITFNPSVRGFTAQDIFVSGGCRGNLDPASSTGTSWRLLINNQDDFKGIVTVGVFSDATSQSGGNNANSTQFNVDTTGGATTTASPATLRIGSIFDSDDNLVNAPLDTAGEYEIDIQSTNKSVGNEFTLDDIVIAGACVPEPELEVTTPGRRWRLPISIPDDEDGIVTIYIPANVVPDGNEPDKLSFDYNTKDEAALSARPTVGLPYSAATAGNRLNELDITADSFYVDISFDSEVTGFTVGDIVVTNACKVSLTPALSTGRQWRLQIDNDDAFEGRVTVIIPSDVTTQSGGNLAASNSYVVNTTQATTTGNPTTFRILNAYDQSTAGTNLTPEQDSILETSPVYIQITSTRSVSDFDPSDIVVSNGCVGVRTTITSGLEWRLLVGLADNSAGTMTVTIPPNVVSVGNENASKGFQYNTIPAVVDPAEPTLGDATANSDGTGTPRMTGGKISATSFFVPIDFGQNVTDFDIDDVIVTNACKGSDLVPASTTTGQTWYLSVDNYDEFDGTVTVAIASNVISNSEGNIAVNRNYEVNTRSDAIQPVSVTLGTPRTSIAGTTAITGDITTGLFYVPITFSGTAAIDGFTIEDIIVTNAGRSNLQPKSSMVLTGSEFQTGRAFMLTVATVSGEEVSASITVPANVIRNPGGNTSASRTYSIDTATLPDPAQPVLKDATANSDGTGTPRMANGKIIATSFFVPIDFGKTVRGFDINDVIVTNACKGTDLVPASTTTGQTWYLSVDNYDEFEGTVTVAIAANVISNIEGNYPANRNYDVNTRPDAIAPTTVTLHTPRTSIAGTTAITGDITTGLFYVPITFSGTAAIDGFTIEDIIVTNGGRSNLQAKSSMVLTGSTFQTGRAYMLTVATISGEDVPISVTVPANVIRNPGGNTRVSRTYNVDTTTTEANPVEVTLHAPRTSIAGTTAITGDITTGSFYVPITFGGTANITGFEASDITVINAGRGNLSPKDNMVLTGSQFQTGRAFMLKVDTISGEETVVTVSVPFNASSQAGGNLAASRTYNVNTRGTAVDSASVDIRSPRANRDGSGVLTGDISNSVFYVPIVFGGTQTITGFTESDIVVNNGCNEGITPKGSGVLSISEFNGLTGRAFLLRIEPTAGEKEVITVFIPANVTTQSGGNLSASRQFNANTTLTPVSVTIHSARSDSAGQTVIMGDIKSGTFYVPIVFGGTTTVNGFDASYITVTNGGRGALNELTGSGFPTGRSFILTVNTISGEENTVTVSIPSNASNLSSGSLAASKNFSVDTSADPEEPATVTLGDPYTASSGGSRITSTITAGDFYVPITFNKVVRGFDKNDVSVASGCRGDLTVQTTNKIWRVHIDNYDQFKGVVTVTIPANVVDGAGNEPATRQYAVNTRMTVTPTTYVIQSARSSADSTQGASEPIRTARWYVYITSTISSSNLLADDILVTSATKARTVRTVANNHGWTLQITNPTNFNGIVSIAVPGGVNTRSNGNYATSRNFAVNTTREITTTTPTPANFSIGPIYDSPTGGSLISTNTAIERTSIYVQIDSGGIAVADFSETDVIVSGGCAGNFTEQTGGMIAANTQWRLYIDLEDDTAGYVTIAIPPNVVSVGNNSISKSYQYNNLSATTVRVPPGAIFNVPITLQTGTTSDIRVNFGERVTGLTNSDFQMTGYTPPPTAIEVLARDFEIQLSSATSTTPSITTIGTGVPSVSSVTRSPNAPSSGETRLWMITLSSEHEQLMTNNISGATISRRPSFIDDNYILRITNPSNAEGTLNAILQNDSVRSVDDDTLGPSFQQSSGSYGFNTIIKPSFSIDKAYESDTATEALSDTLPISNAIIWIEISISPSDSSVTGFADTDIFVTGACSGTLKFTGTADDKKWRIQVNVPEDIAGELTVAIPSDVIEEGNDPISKTFSFDRSGTPYLVVTGYYENGVLATDADGNKIPFPPDEVMGSNVELQITAYVNGIPTAISGLEDSDFEITSTDGKRTANLDQA